MLEKTNEFIKRAHGIACAHGFHDVELSVEHCMMLVLTEVSEMVEADRRNRHCDAELFLRIIGNNGGTSCDGEIWLECFRSYVKETVEDEMADVMIRLYDMCGAFGIEFNDDYLGVSMVDEYNEVRGRSFTEKAFMLCGMLCSVDSGEFPLDVVLGSALSFVECWAKDMGVDLVWHVENKMCYNESRSIRHGKQY